MTREEVADRLGVTVAEVRRRQRVGSIPAPLRKTGPRGELLWERETIEKMAVQREKQKNAATYTTEEASKVFKAFEEGLSDIECVVKLQVSPASIKALRDDYSDLKGSLYIPEDVLKQINDLELDGPLPIQNAEDLLAFMTSIAAAKCGECNKRPRLFCKGCVTEAIKTTREKLKAELEGTDGL